MDVINSTKSTGTGVNPVNLMMSPAFTNRLSTCVSVAAPLTNLTTVTNRVFSSLSDRARARSSTPSLMDVTNNTTINVNNVLNGFNGDTYKYVAYVPMNIRMEMHTK